MNKKHDIEPEPISTKAQGSKNSFNFFSKNTDSVQFWNFTIYIFFIFCLGRKWIVSDVGFGRTDGLAASHLYMLQLIYGEAY